MLGKLIVMGRKEVDLGGPSHPHQWHWHDRGRQFASWDGFLCGKQFDGVKENLDCHGLCSWARSEEIALGRSV